MALLMHVQHAPHPWHMPVNVSLTLNLQYILTPNGFITKPQIRTDAMQATMSMWCSDQRRINMFFGANVATASEAVSMHMLPAHKAH